MITVEGSPVDRQKTDCLQPPRRAITLIAGTMNGMNGMNGWKNGNWLTEIRPRSELSVVTRKQRAGAH